MKNTLRSKLPKKPWIKVYQAARESRLTSFTSTGGFDNLSRSIGTTSSALLMDLRSAVKSTKSDMEIMTGASEHGGTGTGKDA